MLPGHELAVDWVLRGVWPEALHDWQVRRQSQHATFIHSRRLDNVVNHSLLRATRRRPFDVTTVPYGMTLTTTWH